MQAWTDKNISAVSNFNNVYQDIQENYKVFSLLNKDT